MSGMSYGRDSMSLRVNLLAGTTATTNIALTGAEVGDEIIFVGHITLLAAIATLADLTTEGSITSAGNFQMASTNTANDQLWVFWNDVSGGVRPRDANYFRFSLGDGMTAAGDIAISGIETEDELIFVGEFATKASILTFTDRTSEASITSSGNIQLSTTDSSSNQLFVVWNDLSGGVGKSVDATALKITLAAGAGANTNIAISGIATEDTLLSVMELTAAAAIESCADVTSIASITSAGNIQLTSSSSSNQLIVIWLDNSL